MIIILNNKEMTRQGYLVFHPLSSVKECQVRTNMLSFIIRTLIIIIIIRTLLIIIIILAIFTIILIAFVCPMPKIQIIYKALLIIPGSCQTRPDQTRPDQTRPDQRRLQSCGPNSRTCVLVSISLHS